MQKFFFCFKNSTKKNIHLILNLFFSSKPQSQVAIKFFPLQMKYDRMRAHLSLAGISPFDNHWDCIHDFTPSESEQSNWQVMPYEIDVCRVFELNNDQFACGDADKFDFTDTLRWFCCIIFAFI